jgi:hypothetical protein
MRRVEGMRFTTHRNGKNLLEIPEKNKKKKNLKPKQID